MDAGVKGALSERRGIPWRSVALMAVVGIAFGLRAVRLGAQGFWFDEAYTHWIARLPLSESWRAIGRRSSPASVLAVAKVALLLGQGERQCLPSAIFGALTVWVVFRLGARWAGSSAAWISALLLAVSLIHVWHSGDARMYSLLVLLGSGCMLAFTSGSALPASEARQRWPGFYAPTYPLLRPLVPLVHSSIYTPSGTIHGDPAGPG
jgi:uncharacterized membrane protein